MRVITLPRRTVRRVEAVTPNVALVLTAVALTSLLAGSAKAQTFSVRYAFNGGPDGSLSQPFADLVQDAAGNLYGTTSGIGCLGNCDSCLNGCDSAPGAIFKLTPSGKLTTVHTFDCATEGCTPLAGLVGDKAGNAYGTTQSGNTVWGTVYKVDATKHETLLHSFIRTDGSLPQSQLLRDPAGNLYGTTVLGGDLECDPSGGCGVVFKISNAGEFTVLHSFTGGEDGSLPIGGLVMDTQGNLYGTTELGGGSGCLQNLGCGTIFKIEPNGQETVLYPFVGGTDGANPGSDLFLDPTGNLYGTTAGGGGTVCQGNGCGTVFKLNKNGVETVLYRFTGGTDGFGPAAGLVGDSAGNFYGTTVEGAQGFGTVFALRPNGKLVTLHSFTGGDDGANPEAKLLRDSHGTLYGTTRSGGDLHCPYSTGLVPGCGVVFSISLP